MPEFSRAAVQRYWEASDRAQTTAEKGKALEDLICYLFESLPDITFSKRNALNAFASEEIDVAVWNQGSRQGLGFLPEIILIECKNWSKPVGSEEVNWFDSKLKRRSQTFGILVAANGITGDPQRISAAHEIVRVALSEGRRLVVITRAEIDRLEAPNDLVRLLQEKLLELVVSGTLLFERDRGTGSLEGDGN